MKTFKVTILLLFLFHLIPAEANTTLNSARSDLSGKLSYTNTDTAEVNSLTRIGFKILSKSGSPEAVKDYIDDALLICEKKNIEIPSLLHLLMAEYHYSTGDFRSASEEASTAFKQSASSGELKVLARTNFFLGKYYLRTGLYKESIEYYENSINVAEKSGLKGLIPLSFYGQADVYQVLGDLNGYRKNLQLMIEAAFKEKDSAFVTEGLHFLGTSFCGDSVNSEKRNFRMADSLLKKSIEIGLAINDTVIISRSLANTGWNYYLEKMYDSSLACYNRSLNYSIPAKIFAMSANSLGNLGTIYRDLGYPGKAIMYYDKAIKFAKEVNNVSNLWWIYMDMSDLYLSLQDTANAYKSYVLFKKYNDLNTLKTNTQGFADARIRYEADTHNKEVELLSLRLKNNRLLNYGFTGLIILIISIGLLLLRGSKLKNKRRISEMNRKISEITQANLRQQMNPHFIFNTLNSIQYYMYQHDKLATNNYLTKFSNLMRKVLDNSQHTSVPLNDELNALKLYLELECIRFKDKFDFEIKVDEEIDPLMYKVPTMLIQPYVENSICSRTDTQDGKGICKDRYKTEPGSSFMYN